MLTYLLAFRAHCSVCTKIHFTGIFCIYETFIFVRIVIVESMQQCNVSKRNNHRIYTHIISIVGALGIGSPGDFRPSIQPSTYSFYIHTNEKRRCDFKVNIEELIILLQRIHLQDIGQLLYIVWKTLRNVSND